MQETEQKKPRKQTANAISFLTAMAQKKEAREKAKSEVVTPPESLISAIQAMIPPQCLELSPRHDLTPSDKFQLMQALLEFCKQNPNCFHVDDFISHCTQLPATYIKDSIEGFDCSKLSEEEQKTINLACRLLGRARVVCERNISANHIKNNAQFAALYLKNRYGYIDKTEQKTEVSGSQEIKIIMHVPPPKPLPPEFQVEAVPVVDSKHLPSEITPKLPK